MRMMLLACIRLYQLAISPLFPSVCRFQPTCSEYAKDAVALHGALGGGGLALKRILRCHPLGGSGYDPVPMPGPHGDPRPHAAPGRRS